MTKAEGRNLLELDGRPAAKVYNEWTLKRIAKHMDPSAPAAERNILAASSVWPLGRYLGHPDDYSEPFYQTMHPNEVLPDMGINLFAEVATGDTLTLMTGTLENVQTRIANAAVHCTKHKGIEANEVRGALVIFCVGCMLAIQPTMDKACRNLSRSLGGCPFIGAHCFGEQGEFAGARSGSKHGNLMFGTVVFTNRSKRPEITDRGSALYHAMRKAGMWVPRFLQPYNKTEIQHLPRDRSSTWNQSRRVDAAMGELTATTSSWGSSRRSKVHP